MTLPKSRYMDIFSYIYIHNEEETSCDIIWYHFNPLNAELNPICPLLALFWAHHILHVSR